MLLFTSCSRVLRWPVTRKAITNNIVPFLFLCNYCSSSHKRKKYVNVYYMLALESIPRIEYCFSFFDFLVRVINTKTGRQQQPNNRQKRRSGVTNISSTTWHRAVASRSSAAAMRSLSTSKHDRPLACSSTPVRAHRSV